MDKFNLDLSLVARLGGYSAPRTHRRKERFPGMTVTCAMIDSLPVVLEKTKERIFAPDRIHYRIRSLRLAVSLKRC